MAKRKNRAATEAELGLITDIQPDARMTDHHEQHSNANKAILDLYEALDIDVDGNTGDIILGADFGNNVPDPIAVTDQGKVLATDGTDYGWVFVDSQNIKLTNAPGSPFGITEDSDYAGATSQAEANALFVKYITENENAVKALAAALGLEINVHPDGSIIIEIPNNINARYVVSGDPSGPNAGEVRPQTVQSGYPEITPDIWTTFMFNEEDLDGDTHDFAQISAGDVLSVYSANGENGNPVQANYSIDNVVSLGVFEVTNLSYSGNFVAGTILEVFVGKSAGDDLLDTIVGFEKTNFIGNFNDFSDVPGSPAYGDTFLRDIDYVFYTHTNKGWVVHHHYNDWNKVLEIDSKVDENTTNIGNLVVNLGGTVNPDGSIDVDNIDALPDGGNDGDFLTIDAAGEAAWVDADVFPKGTSSYSDAKAVEDAIAAITGLEVLSFQGNVSDAASLPGGAD